MRLISWNIQWGRGVDGRVDLDRIAAHASGLADFDVLCLQEVTDGHDDLPGCDGADQFAALAARFPGYGVIAGVALDVPSPSGARRRFGNLILSRYPVGPVFRHLLPWPADAGLPSIPRVAVEATLITPVGLMRVVTTHLEYYSAIQRRAQVERLRDLHAEACAHHRTRGAPSDAPFEPLARGSACVLTGDFNFRADSAEYARITASFGDGTPAFRDAWPISHPGRPHDPTVGLRDKEQWPGEPFACDFVFVSDDLRDRVRTMKVDASTDASDHQPVLLELDLS